MSSQIEVGSIIWNEPLDRFYLVIKVTNGTITVRDSEICKNLNLSPEYCFLPEDIPDFGLGACCEVAVGGSNTYPKGTKLYLNEWPVSDWTDPVEFLDSNGDSVFMVISNVKIAPEKEHLNSEIFPGDLVEYELEVYYVLSAPKREGLVSLLNNKQEKKLARKRDLKLLEKGGPNKRLGKYIKYNYEDGLYLTKDRLYLVERINNTFGCVFSDLKTPYNVIRDHFEFINFTTNNNSNNGKSSTNKESKPSDLCRTFEVNPRAGENCEGKIYNKSELSEIWL
jgi:hypothetical protein